MSFNPVVAIRLTPYYSRLVGWDDLRGRVFAALGFRTRNPTAREFVTAVRRWQLDHAPLTADGLLGPATWAILAPTVRAYRGLGPGGTRPDWLDRTARKVARPLASPDATRTADSPEDRAIQALIQAWTAIADRRLGDPCLPVPVSTAHAEQQARHGRSSVATADMFGDLRVGQVWQGASGADRIIVALTGSGRRAGTGAVVFVTDSGQAYAQPAAGWAADVMAGVYAGNSRAPTPVHAIFDDEVHALFGAISIAGAEYPVAAGLSASQWVVHNREVIAAWVSAMGLVAESIARLRESAPTLMDTVLRGALGRTLMEGLTPTGGPKQIARLVGALLVRPGKSSLGRQAAGLNEALASLENWAVAATIWPPAEVVTGADRKAVLSPVPDLVRRHETGAAVGRDAAARIRGEIGNNPMEVKDLIGHLRRGLRALASHAAQGDAAQM